MERDRKSAKIKDQRTFAEKLFRVFITVIVVISIWAAIAVAVAKQSYATASASQDYGFGVVGHSYEIIEQDIIEYIKEKLSTQDLAALNKEMQEKVKARLEKPEAVVGVTDSKENREHYYDPTFVLKQDIKDHKGQLIHAKGKVINPLSHTPLSKALIFINGDNTNQVEYALSQYRDLDGRAKIILTSGSPMKLQRAHKDVWIYFDQFGALTKKLAISAVPAIVKQDGLKLKIHEVALK